MFNILANSFDDTNIDLKNHACKAKKLAEQCKGLRKGLRRKKMFLNMFFILNDLFQS